MKNPPNVCVCMSVCIVCVCVCTLAHSVSIHSGARDEVLCILPVLFRKFISLGVTVIGIDLSTGQYPVTVG